MDERCYSVLFGLSKFMKETDPDLSYAISFAREAVEVRPSSLEAWIHLAECFALAEEYHSVAPPLFLSVYFFHGLCLICSYAVAQFVSSWMMVFSLWNVLTPLAVCRVLEFTPFSPRGTGLARGSRHQWANSSRG